MHALYFFNFTFCDQIIHVTKVTNTLIILYIYLGLSVGHLLCSHYKYQDTTLQLEEEYVLDT